jgi:chemosensory pili system protein ChpA (sensor histidine kinase/response regulator)
MTTVLVVEDELNIRKFVAANLKARGFQVMEAPDAETGWETLQNTVPDLMVLDIKLPGMDGWQLLELVIGDARLEEVPVVVMTAHVMDSEARQVRFPNVSEVIFKPVSAAQLVGAVNKALNGVNEH